MIDHSKIKEVVARLRSTGNDEDARIVETLHINYREMVGRLMTRQMEVDFYARLADAKLNWGQ